MQKGKMMSELTPEANRAARAILKWSVRDLADHAGIAFTTVNRFELTGTATETTKGKIIAAYSAHGVMIVDNGARGALLLPEGSDPVHVEIVMKTIPAGGEGVRLAGSDVPADPSND